MKIFRIPISLSVSVSLSLPPSLSLFLSLSLSLSPSPPSLSLSLSLSLSVSLSFSLPLAIPYSRSPLTITFFRNFVWPSKSPKKTEIMKLKGKRYEFHKKPSKGRCSIKILNNVTLKRETDVELTYFLGRYSTPKSQKTNYRFDLNVAACKSFTRRWIIVFWLITLKSEMYV